jgi:hypothetical protein
MMQRQQMIMNGQHGERIQRTVHGYVSADNTVSRQYLLDVNPWAWDRKDRGIEDPDYVTRMNADEFKLIQAINKAQLTGEEEGGRDKGEESREDPERPTPVSLG